MGVLGMTDLLLDRAPKLDGATVSELQTIKSSGTALLTLINNILELSRLDAKMTRSAVKVGNFRRAADGLAARLSAAGQQRGQRELTRRRPQLTRLTRRRRPQLTRVTRRRPSSPAAVVPSPPGSPAAVVPSSPGSPAVVPAHPAHVPAAVVPMYRPGPDGTCI